MVLNWVNRLTCDRSPFDAICATIRGASSQNSAVIDTYQRQGAGLDEVSEI